MYQCNVGVSTVLALSMVLTGQCLRQSLAVEPQTDATQAAAPKSKLAEQIATIAAEHEKQQTAFYDELKSLAKKSKELGREEYRKQVGAANNKFREYNSPAAEKLAELIKANPNDPAVVEGIMLYEGPMSHSISIVPEFQAILLGQQFANPALGKLCFRMRYCNNDKSAEAILTAAAARHPLPEVRGLATYALGEYYRQTARDWGHAPKTEAERNQLLSKAAQHLTEVVNKYADVESPDGKGPLGKLAAVTLTRVKNIPNLAIGKPAPEVAGEDLDGKPIKLSDYRGKAVMLVYWGSWCGPCMAQVPHEREIHERLKDKPFVLLGVNCGDPREKAQQTAKDKQMPWTNVWDGGTNDGPFQAAYNVEHWPTIYLIDAQGVIQAIDLHGAELDKALDELVAK
jgi:peroxiredoxin